MKRRSAARRGVVAGACAGVLFLAGGAQCDATERTWTFVGGALFSDPGRWSGNAIPGSGDNARFTIAGTYSVLFATNPTNTLASLTDGDVTFSLGGETYTLSSTSTTSLVVGGTKGSFPAVLAKLTIGGGTLSDHSAIVGNTQFGTGQVTVSNGTWNNANTLNLGSGGTGTMFVNAAGVVSCADTNLGVNSGITGNATIGGSGAATWTISGLLDVGANGTGNVTVNTGGHLNTTSTSADAILGDLASGKGTVTIASGSWSNSAGIRIGNAGAGSVNLSTGSVTCGNAYLGFSAGAAGSINLTGLGTISAAGSMFVGGNSSTAGGTGQVTISAGTVNVANELKIWSGGTVNSFGNRLAVGSLTLAGGTLNWSGELSVAADAGVSIGPTGTFPSLTVVPGQRLYSSVTVGAGGSGSLSVLGGQISFVITNDIVTPNALSVASGTVLVDGPSAKLYATFFDLGTATSSGTVIVRNGGQLGAGGTVMQSGSAGPSLVTIDGGYWDNSSQFVDKFRLLSGTIRLLNGGVYSTHNEDTYIGYLGTATLDIDGSVCGLFLIEASKQYDLYVGQGGSGTVAVHNGGSLTVQMPLILGENGSGMGFLSIDGSTSVASCADVNVLSGSMTVSNGGSLTCTHGTIGRSVGPSTATVTLSGAGSAWKATDGIDVGLSGGGSHAWLTVGPGTKLDPGSALDVWPGGVFEFHSASMGTLTTLNLASGKITGDGAFPQPVSSSNGAIIDVPVSSTLSFASPVTNAAGSNLSKTGAGTAILNSFIQPGSGSLIITAGTVILNNDAGASGSLSVSINNPGSAIHFGAAQHLAALQVNDGRGVLLSGANKVIVTKSLLVDSTDAQLDLTDEDMIVDYTGSTPLSAIAGYLHSGFAGGMWSGNGIASTSAASVAADGSNRHKTALGYAEAGTLGVGSFSGQSVDNTSILVRCTLSGDANLDGTVNTLDFTALSNHFNQSGKLWSDGDFNYDGVVNALDFNAIATNFGQALPSPLLGALVPEPALLILPAAILLLRARRKEA